MRKRHWIVLSGVMAAAVLVAWLLREPLAEDANAKSPTTSSIPVQTGKNVRSLAGITGQNVLPQLAMPLLDFAPNLFASPATKMRQLSTLGDPFAAQLQAVRSGDPLQIAHALYMTLHCMDMPVQLHGKSAREVLTESSYDPKTGKKAPQNEALIAMHEAMQTAGPLRMRPPPELVAEVARFSQTWGIVDSPDYARQAELFKKMAAPISSTQRASWASVVERSASECRGRLFSSEFSAEYRAALDRLVANGVVSAQLFNRRAGWQSNSLSELNDRDYELVQRALAESQPDGIARLLIGGSAAVGRFDDTGFAEADLNAGMALQFMLGPLTACALGVSECGPDSARFRTLCHMSGGCDQPDTAALLRHVFDRDGIDPSIVDREINRVVDAFRTRDLEALAVRRKQ
jgi:hypothetical protein